jgi:hypothetical protein
MAVPSSGQLRLRADIANEVDGNATGSNVSLGTLADTAGFDTPPDTMQEFYGYQSCGTPTGVENNIFSAGQGSVFFRARYTGSNGGCDVVEYGYYLGTSSNRASNTKYVKGTDNKGLYSNWDNTFTGLADSTTYYGWAYVTNSAGYTAYAPYASSGSTNAPVIPISSYSYSFYGDFTGANYCPNFNFNGGANMQWYNNTTSTSIAVYGDGNFEYASSGSKPNCINTQTFGTDTSARNRNISMSNTCYDRSSCNSGRTFYCKWYTSGYTDIVNSQYRACPAC